MVPPTIGANDLPALDSWPADVLVRNATRSAEERCTFVGRKEVKNACTSHVAISHGNERQRTRRAFLDGLVTYALITHGSPLARSDKDSSGGSEPMVSLAGQLGLP